MNAALRVLFPKTMNLLSVLVGEYEMEPLRASMLPIVLLMSVALDVLCLPFVFVGWLVILALCALSTRRRHWQFGHGRQRMIADGNFARCGQCGGVDCLHSWRWRRSVREVIEQRNEAFELLKGQNNA